MRRGKAGAVVLATVIGAGVGLVVAGLPELAEPTPRPVVATTVEATTTTVATSESLPATDLNTLPASTTTTTPLARATTTTTEPDPATLLSGLTVEVVNAGSPGGTASAVADRLNSEFGTDATAGDGPSEATSYVASTPRLSRAAEVIAFLLGIDEIRMGELTGTDRIEVVLGPDFQE